MRNLFLIFCLVITALFGSVRIGNATDLPKCVPGVTSSWAKTETWDNCKGVFFRQVGHRYEGEWVNGKLNGRGTETLRDKKSAQIKYKYVGEWQDNLWHGNGFLIKVNGTAKEGVWKNGKFQYAQKTSYSPKIAKSSLLRTNFNKLTKNQRKKVQSSLKNLGLYKSSIDGLYGKGTAGALTAYNRQNLNGADLKKLDNVVELLDTVLALTNSLSSTPATAIELIQAEKLERLQQYANLGMTPSQIKVAADNFDKVRTDAAIQVMVDEVFRLEAGKISKIIAAIRAGNIRDLATNNGLYNSVTYLHFQGKPYVDIAAELASRQTAIFHYMEAEQRAKELAVVRQKKAQNEDNRTGYSDQIDAN